MNARHSLAVLAALALVSTEASASVLSASSQTARLMSTDHAGYLDVNAMQTDLNASMNDAVNHTPALASFTGNAPVLNVGGGFYVQSGTAGARVALPTSYGGTMSNFGASNSDYFGGLFGGGLSDNVHHQGFGGALGRGRSWRTGGRGGVQAAPEPSTWLLLGTGLGMLGLFTGLKRRASRTI